MVTSSEWRRASRWSIHVVFAERLRASGLGDAAGSVASSLAVFITGRKSGSAQ
jgi:hypothetical protein